MKIKLTLITLLDATNGDVMTGSDERIEQPLSHSQRTRTRARRESGVDYWCYVANIERLGIVRAHYLWCAMSE